MASIQTVPLPKSYSSPKESKGNLSAPSTRHLLPAGPAYLSHLRLSLHHNNSFEAQDAHNDKERQRLEELYGSSSNGAQDDLGVGDEEEPEELLTLDPKEWKVYSFFFVLSYDMYSRCRRVETRSLRCPGTFPSALQGYS